MTKHRSSREVNRSPVPEPSVPPEITIPEKPKGKILKEVIEKRAKYVKHFFKDDLTFEAAIYNDAVHYFNEGKWKDIDNTLIDGKDDDNNDVLENKHNDFKVKIAKKAKTEKFITISKEQYEVTWGIDKAKEVAGKVKLQAQPRKERHQEHKKKNKAKDEKRQVIQARNEREITLTNISSKVEFLDISPSVDFQYEIIGDKVKENIIIKEKITTPSFIYNLSVKNLVPILQEDRSILFYDDKDSSKGIFIMKPPFMYDGKGINSSEIDVTLIKTNNEYKLSLIPSDEWLKDKERVYPVTIDPYIKTSQDVTSIQDSFIGSFTPNQNNYEAVLLGVGQGTASGTTRSLIKFTLPDLTAADLIINAELRLFLYTANSTTRQVDVHNVTHDWSSSSITWNNQPTYNTTKIEDYQLVQGGVGSLFKWDVTSVVKDWYNVGNNYGLLLKYEDESTGYNEFVSSDTSSEFIGYRPQIVLTYVNNSGLESYWTYHSQDVRRAGTGYINDYNGNVIFVHNDINMSGNKLPLTLNHVFNSNEKDSSIGYGLGWRLNVSQRVENGGIIDGAQWYIYTDEDGTKHYFYYDSASASYKEQMGLDLTFTINADGGYTIKDKSGGVLEFLPSGYLHKIKDKNDNTITLIYEGIMLKKITDGAGRITTLDVLSNGYLIGIIDPSGRRTSFAYAGIQLSKITYPDGEYTTYTYDTSNKLLSILNYDGYKITYTYYPQAPYRVKKVEEFGSDGLTGGSLNISYGHYTTTFIDARNRKNIYQFNDYGNTINIRDDDGSAGYYKYMTGNLSNKLSTESKLQKFSKNYLKNHNVEASSDWSIYNEAGSIGSSSYTTEDKYLGSQSIKIIKTNTIAKYSYTQPLTLVKGNTYCLSGYIKTSEISNTNGLGAMLEIVYQDGNSAWLSVNSQYLNGTNDWQRVEVKFKLPVDSVSITAYAKFGIAGETGTAYFDCLQFEDGSIANRYNFIENADLSYGQPIPNFWSKNAFCDSNDISTAIDGKMAFRINGSATKSKYISQTIQVSGKLGDVFLLSGWAKGESTHISGNRRFSLEVGIRKLDDTDEWHIIFFNEDSSDWQYITDRIVTLADYKSVTLYAEYYNNVNTAYFTNFQLNKEEFGASYIYDEKGNVSSILDVSKQKTTFEYDGNNDLIKAISPAGSAFVYDRDSQRNITTATSATNVIYSFTYDSSGNPLTAKVGGGTLFMESIARYTLSGSYLKSLSDGQDNSIINHYDEAKGILRAATDAKGNKTTYSYNTMDQLTSVSNKLFTKNLEKFLLNLDTTGIKGTKPIEENAVFYKDDSGKSTFAAFEGTTNLLFNTSYESGTSGWAIGDWSGSTGAWRRVVDGVDGSYSLESYDSDGLMDGSGTNAVANQLISLNTALSTSKQYTLSAYAKRIGTDQPQLGILSYDVNGVAIPGGYQNYTKTIVENEWVRISNTFTLTAGTKSFLILLRSSVKDNEVVRFDGVQLEEKAFTTPYTVTSRLNSKAYYDLGLDKRSGTMSIWFNTIGSGERMILGNEGSSGEVFNVYINQQNQIVLNSRDNAGVIQNMIVVNDISILNNQWYFIALKWQWNNTILSCTLYVNDRIYTGNTSNFKDFTGGITAIGSSIFSAYLLNGFIEQFAYTPNALSAADINLLYTKTMGDDLGTTVSNNYTYENDRIKTVDHNGFSYNFEYDGIGRSKKVYVENQVLVENTFEQNTGNLLQSIYGGNINQKINIDYDNLDRVTSRKFNDIERYKYGYDNSGNLGYHEDKVNNKSYKYTYDLSDRLVKADEISGDSSNINSVKFGYDKNNNHNKITQKINGSLYETKYGYDKDNKPIEVLYGLSSADNTKVEYFPLNGSTIGSKGTLPVTETPVFQKDENGETVLSSKVGTKVVYNLDINKTSGTMTSWFSANGQGSRIIFANEGTGGELLNVYVDINQKVNLAVRNNAGIYTNVITTDETVGSNEWNFAAAKWQFDGSSLTCTLYLNSKAYTANVTSFKDFTGMQTAVGSNISGGYSLTGLSKKFSYSSSALSENEILSMYYNSRVNYSYDALGRMNSKTTNTEIFSYATEYTYVPGTNTNATTSKVASIKNNNGVPITYEYDANGNISKVTQGIMNIIYLYNELNELIQEDNQVLNKTIIYSYDVGGNLMSKLEIPYGGSNTTIAYSYDTVWNDKLISYNGKPITYDAIGNPLTYDGYTYTWEEGRQLKSIIGNSKNISYKYNDAGIRTEMDVDGVDGVVTKYNLLGDKVILEDNGADKIYYTYDSHNDLVSMNLNGVEYYYIRNAQGDIIGLYDKNGMPVVSYIYDTWGKLISTTGTLASTVGVKNPYRYRGYRYDTETGLYYLQSRYYNPEWGRFINPDSSGGEVGTLLSHNVFAYCMNNPVNMADPSGNIAWWIVGAAVGAIAGAAYSYYTTGSVNWKYVVGGALIGAGLGYLAKTAYATYTTYTATIAAAQKAMEQSSKIKQGWNMVKGGARIGGRKYTEHALERMAPNTPQVRAELTKRALDKGIKFGTQQFKSYVDPRGIPTMVVEHTINYGGRMPGNRPGTWVSVGEDVRVVINLFGDVMSVIPK